MASFRMMECITSIFMRASLLSDSSPNCPAKAVANRIIIPLGQLSSVERRKQAMRQMRRDGLSNGQTAKVLGVHRRTVELYHQVNRRLGLAFKEQNTLDLFED